MRWLLNLLCAGFLTPWLALMPRAQAAEPLVLVSDPWCPVACGEQDPRPGYVVELAQAIFEPLGYPVQYQIVPFSRAEMLVNRGEVSGFIGVLQLPKRQSWHFPKHPQAVSRVCFYTLPGQRWQFSGLASLEGLRLGVIRGYNYGPELEPLLPLAHRDEISGVDALRRNMAKLQAGRVQALVEYELVAQYQQFSSGLKLRNAGCTQTADALFLAFSPQQPGGAKLAQLLDEGMQRMRKSGELARILQRYGVQDWVSGAKELK